MTPIAQLVSSHAAEVEGYERRAAAAQGTAVRLDPARVAKCRHTNFAVDYFSPEFQRLKASIERVSGNIEPIKVRPMPEGGHEIVYGHARLQACLELGLAVAAVVDELQDREVVLQFVLHQSFKSKPSPWRLGAVLAVALDSGVFPSIRRMADAVGMDLSEVATLTRLHRLPDVLKEAQKGKFLSPRAIKKLLAGYETDPAKHRSGL